MGQYSSSHASEPSVTMNQTCLAEAIYHEAGGEPLEGQYAVGQVIMNRIEHGVAKTPCGVVRQHAGNRYQFSFNKTRKTSVPSFHKAYFMHIAIIVMSGNNRYGLPSNVLYFNNTPFKAKKFSLYRKIGKQYFYTERSRKNVEKRWKS